MGSISVFAFSGFFCVTLLMVTRMAHEFGPVPLLGVLACEHVQQLHLFLVEVKPPAHLVQVEILDLTNAVLFRFFVV